MSHGPFGKEATSLQNDYDQRESLELREIETLDGELLDQQEEEVVVEDAAEGTATGVILQSHDKSRYSMSSTPGEISQTGQADRCSQDGDAAAGKFCWISWVIRRFWSEKVALVVPQNKNRDHLGEFFPQREVRRKICDRC